MSAILLDDLVARVDTLPQMPDTVHRLITVVSDPQSTLQQIVAAIRYDQGLTAEVLRLCNSAYFGLPRRIESLDDAVCLLGTVRVFQIVMAAQARAVLSAPQQGYGLPAGALSAHSVGVAVGAQLLARRLQIAQPGLAFTAGLLHDVGKVVLNEFVAAQYAEILHQVAECGRAFIEAEQDVLGYTHADLAGQLAEKWSLPENIVRCIRWHHVPAEPPEAVDPLVDAVYLANLVCLLLGIGLGEDALACRASSTVLTRHGLKENDLEAIGAEVISELRSVKALFAAG